MKIKEMEKQRKWNVDEWKGNENYKQINGKVNERKCIWERK